MRLLMIVFGLFVFVATDLTVNNGATIRVWAYHVTTLMRSVGIT